MGIIQLVVAICTSLGSVAALGSAYYAMRSSKNNVKATKIGEETIYQMKKQLNASLLPNIVPKEMKILIEDLNFITDNHTIKFKSATTKSNEPLVYFINIGMGTATNIKIRRKISKLDEHLQIINEKYNSLNDHKLCISKNGSKMIITKKSKIDGKAQDAVYDVFEGNYQKITHLLHIQNNNDAKLSYSLNGYVYLLAEMIFYEKQTGIKFEKYPFLIIELTYSDILETNYSKKLWYYPRITNAGKVTEIVLDLRKETKSQ